MIIVKLLGGLGNQMFQYAMGRNLAIQNNTELYLDISDYEKQTKRKFELGYFKCKYKLVESGVVEKMKNDRLRIPKNVFFNIFGLLPPGFKSNYLIEKQIYIYNPNYKKLKGDLYLEGYWQSEDYFKEIRDIILNDFEFKNEYDEVDKKVIKEMEKVVSVSMHMRRGDYITDKAAHNHFNLLDFDYYYKAIEMIKKKYKKIKIFVFSDDIDWVKDNFKTKEELCFMRKRDEENNYRDIGMMSHCQHNIMANSSFSWWGSWLNQNKDKIVIAPKAWLNNMNTRTDDLVPKSWIRL